MKFLFLLILYISFPNPGKCQDKIINLTNNDNGKVVRIKKNEKIKIIRNDNQIFEGKVFGIEDSSIIVNLDTIKFIDIHELRIKSSIKQILGASLICIGVIGGVANSILMIKVIAFAFASAIPVNMILFFTSLVVGVPIISLDLLMIIGGKKLLKNENMYPLQKWRINLNM